MDWFFYKKNFQSGVELIDTCVFICFLFDVYMFKFVCSSYLEDNKISIYISIKYYMNYYN